ncbi:hypothetical protein Hamer_G001496 [Homarus americanus]|uniref:Uncharacterized protein n=1 Tax=Homarus americanus TaxID=6706 RepID=A0A8J5TIX8_HOMAM|nr:hypothetical protein Hamer_G001496 [Homarus americanus]
MVPIIIIGVRVRVTYREATVMTGRVPGNYGLVDNSASCHYTHATAALYLQTRASREERLARQNNNNTHDVKNRNPKNSEICWGHSAQPQKTGRSITPYGDTEETVVERHQPTGPQGSRESLSHHVFQLSGNFLAFLQTIYPQEPHQPSVPQELPSSLQEFQQDISAEHSQQSCNLQERQHASILQEPWQRNSLHVTQQRINSHQSYQLSGERLHLPTCLQHPRVPAAQAPTRVPAVQAPTRVPAAQAPTRVPAVQAPTRVPAAQAPTRVPAVQAPTRVPAVQAPTRVPAVQAPTRVPAVQAPTQQSRLPHVSQQSRLPHVSQQSRLPQQLSLPYVSQQLNNPVLSQLSSKFSSWSERCWKTDDWSVNSWKSLEWVKSGNWKPEWLDDKDLGDLLKKTKDWGSEWLESEWQRAKDLDMRRVPIGDWFGLSDEIKDGIEMKPNIYPRVQRWLVQYGTRGAHFNRILVAVDHCSTLEAVVSVEGGGRTAAGGRYRV